MFLDDKKIISQEAKEFISKLLLRDPNERLGAKADSLELMSHQWFKGFNWSFLMDRKMQPPIKPCVDDDKWLDNFNKEFIIQEYRESFFSSGNDGLFREYQKEFEHFNYINNDPDNKLQNQFKGDTKTL